jgi:hypothetical protein
MSSSMETTETSSKVVYENFRELVAEWQSSGTESSLWEYLEISENMFKEWIERCQRGIFDA